MHQPRIAPTTTKDIPEASVPMAQSRRVVRTGGAMGGAEVARAREAGISDGELIEALAHVALKHFTNAVGFVAGTPSEFPKPARAPEV